MIILIDTLTISPYSVYMSKISNLKSTDRLTHEEELTLVKQLPDKRALDRLVTSNLGLVHKITHKFPIKNCNVTYDDLFQEGVAGLIHGIHKYDVTRGYRLSTYVYRWIQARVTRYFQNQGKTIRIPVHMANKQYNYKRVVESLTQELGRTPTQNEIEQVVEDCGGVTESMRDTVSLNQLIGDSEELDCLVGDDKTVERDYILECEMLLDKLSSEVSPRDFNIFIYRHGLLGKSEHTLGEIAEFHDLTRARVHQVSNNVLSKLKELV